MIELNKEYFEKPYYFFLKDKGNKVGIYYSVSETLSESRKEDEFIEVDISVFEEIQDLISKTKSVNQKKGLGVFYWEPQSYNSWKGYKLGAFDDTGKPTVAMDAFMN